MWYSTTPSAHRSARGIDLPRVAQLLGRHVGQRAQPQVRAADTEFANRGQPEVEQLHPTIGEQHHVAGLQIPVHDTGPMHRRQALGDLPRDVERLRHCEWALPPEARPKRLARIQRHGQEELPLDALAGFVNRAEVRVIERRRSAGLLEELRFRGRIET